MSLYFEGRGGLSNKSKVNYGRPRTGQGTKSVIIPVNRSRAQRAAAQRAYNETIAGLSFVQREEMLELDGDTEMPCAYSEDDCRGDPRTRSYRVQKQVDAWESQLPLLVDAYLQYKNIGATKTEEHWPLNVVGFEESGYRLFAHNPNTVRSNQTLLQQGYLGGSPEKPAIAFSIRTFEIYRQIHRVCPRYTIDSLAKTLSYLHKVPRKSYLAEQLTTAYDVYLSILREVKRRVQQALGRDELWDSQNVCPPCFYKLEKEVRLKLSWLGSLDGNNSLKLVDSTFRAGHPRFDNRKSTSFRWLTPSQVDKYMDEVKNSKKKSMATSATMFAVRESLAVPPVPTTSSAVLSSIPTSTQPTSAAPVPDLGSAPASGASAEPEADDFPDGPAEVPDDGTADGDVAWLNLNELDSDGAKELEKCINSCVERWKAAGPEALCRHGHVLVMCHMIRSGELMKYPLAIVAKLFELYGADAGIGYDIMCAFIKTLLCSSLGAKTVGLRMRGIVPTFHRHAHNRMCQIGWHPMYVEGAGLEDFEECERTFCLSNNLASCTRLATPFHRQQQIDEHFYFHDLDKHAASGNFIFQNYRQAVEKITANSLKLRILEDELHTTAADYERDLNDERAHLESLLREPPEVQTTADYIELLNKLQIATDSSDTAKKDFDKLDYLITVKGVHGKALTAIKTRYRTTHTRLLHVEEQVALFEEEHGYIVRWTTDSQEYNDALVLMNERRYRRALDSLERLVVQRLLELTKLSMSGVAYKLREKIGKALKTRADAIQRALIEYNTAAGTLNPPRDQLVWAEVIQTVSLAEFDLLRDTRTDIRRLPWTQPARREAARLYFGIKRAKEEIQRLNVEITRLITFTIDEHVDFYRAIVDTYMTAPHLAHELSVRWQYQARINNSVIERLVKASRLPGFTGSLFPGKRIGRDPSINPLYPLPPWATDTLGLSQVVVEYEEENDYADTARELDGLDTDQMIQLMESLEIDSIDIV
ncbi:hypothetical protein DFH09DRAFT_1339787 [Mycena vulgaris]|nr:hypothetical protein DFH09DRAFT_1339787 [Mycena vulgaris]